MDIKDLQKNYGYIFKSRDLKNYFKQFSWYKERITPAQWAKAGSDKAFFNKYELANRNFWVRAMR